jgi:hypothetical protein
MRASKAAKAATRPHGGDLLKVDALGSTVSFNATFSPSKSPAAGRRRPTQTRAMLRDARRWRAIWRAEIAGRRAEAEAAEPAAATPAKTQASGSRHRSRGFAAAIAALELAEARGRRSSGRRA